MLPKLSSRLTYANVMATIAVFIALGGSSYAALKVTSRNVPKDALTGADIKNLTGKDVRNNSLTGADVKNLTSNDVTDSSLLARDFAPGQLPAGPQGLQGRKGDLGPRGPSDAFISSFGSGSFPVASPGDSPAEIDLPDGAHIVFANVTFHNDSATDPTTVNCGLVPGDAGQGDFGQAIDIARSDLEPPPGAARQTLSLTGATESDIPHTVRLDCYGSGATTGGPLSYEDPDIGAIQVETLTS